MKNDFSSLKIVFLGTGTSVGVPIISCKCKVCQSKDKHDKRLRSSILIKYNNNNIIIDCTPDFRQQMLNNNVDNLSGIILTHGHFDHIGGLDDTRGFNFINKKPIDIYAEKNVLETIRNTFSYAFNSNYEGIPEFVQHEISEYTPFYIADLEFLPLIIFHHKLKILGFLFKKVAYITDANKIENDTLKYLKNLDLLIINALSIKPHFSHFSLSETLQLIEKIKPKKAFLTHMSHNIGLHKELTKILPNNVVPAYDGLEVTIL